MKKDAHKWVGQQQRLEDAMEAGGIAWWEIEMPHGAVMFSQNKTDMLGFEASKFFHYEHFTKLVHPADYDAMMESMKKLITGATDTYESLYRIRCSNGEYVRFFDRGKIVQRTSATEFTIAGIVIRVDDIDQSIRKMLSQKSTLEKAKQTSENPA